MPKKDLLLSKEWEKFSGMVVHKDAPPLQTQEMNLSFYAGALAMLNIITANGDDDFEDVMKAVNDELLKNHLLHLDRLNAVKPVC